MRDSMLLSITGAAAWCGCCNSCDCCISCCCNNWSCCSCCCWALRLRDCDWNRKTNSVITSGFKNCYSILSSKVRLKWCLQTMWCKDEQTWVWDCCSSWVTALRTSVCTAAESAWLVAAEGPCSGLAWGTDGARPVTAWMADWTVTHMAHITTMALFMYIKKKCHTISIATIRKCGVSFCVQYILLYNKMIQLAIYLRVISMTITCLVMFHYLITILTKIETKTIISESSKAMTSYHCYLL